MAKKHTDPYRLFKRGNIYHAYISFARQDGSQVQFRCSTGTTDRAEAVRRTTEKVLELQKTPENTRLTIDEAFGLFYERHSQFLSRPNEQLNRLKNLKDLLNKKYLDEINANALAEFVATRKKSVKNGTINRELMLISSIMTKCDEWGFKIPNVKISKYKLRETAENIKYFDSMETVQKIIDNASPHLKPIIYTALYTGLRRGNLLTLKWENIDFKNNVINVKVKDKTTDGGKNFVIPMIDKLKEILEQQPKVCEYVFTFDGKQIKDISRSWHTALRNANIPYMNFHTLRHTCATWMLKETGNLKLTQQILGHADIKTTTKYAHVLDGEKRSALESVFK